MLKYPGVDVLEFELTTKPISSSEPHPSEMLGLRVVFVPLLVLKKLLFLLNPEHTWFFIDMVLFLGTVCKKKSGI